MMCLWARGKHDGDNGKAILTLVKWLTGVEWCRGEHPPPPQSTLAIENTHPYVRRARKNIIPTIIKITQSLSSRVRKYVANAIFSSLLKRPFLTQHLLTST